MEKDNIVVIADEPIKSAEEVKTEAKTVISPPSETKSQKIDIEKIKKVFHYEKVKAFFCSARFRSFFSPNKIKNTAVSVRDKARDYIKSLPQDLSMRFVRISAAAGAAVTVCVILGAIFIPKSEDALAKGLLRLERKDAAYTAAKGEYDNIKSEYDALSEELNAKKTELEKFKNAGGSLEKITEINAELEKKKQELNDEVYVKQTSLDAMKAELNARRTKIITLTSGYYDVGTDIAAGSYTVTGSGSIAIANSGKAIANKLLKTEGEVFSLKAGDRIQIEGSAKFIP